MSNSSTLTGGKSIAGLKRKKILVVEDHSEARRMLSIALNKVGFDVLTASSGSTALSMVREHKPDLLLLDIKLSDSVHGLTVCERVKSDAISQSIGVIIMSGHNDYATIQEAKRAGANAFMVKPFKLSNLIDLVTAEPFQTDAFTLVRET